MDTITVRDSQVTAKSAEGAVAAMPVAEFVRRLSPRRMDTAGVVLPDGAKCITSRGQATIVVVELSPRIVCLRWIARDSPAPFGPHTRYRDVTIALPYVVILAGFAADPAGELHMTRSNECYFRNSRLNSPDDELLFPALLNCSKWPVEDGHPLSWICTQHLNFDRLAAVPDANARVRASLAALVQCLLGTGFNLSSEHHEGNSWFSFTVAKSVDPRIASVETWQDATLANQLFCLEVPWLPTGRTLGQICDRVFALQQAADCSMTCGEDLARIVFNSQTG